MKKTTEEVKKFTIELTEKEMTALRVSVFTKKEAAKENFDFWEKMAKSSEDKGGFMHEGDVKNARYWEKELATLESVYKKIWEAH